MKVDLVVPVIGGVAAAVKVADMLVRPGMATSKRGDYAAPLAKVMQGWRHRGHRCDARFACASPAPVHMYPQRLNSKRNQDGTVKEEARGQENHFCQASQEDGQWQKAPQVRRHPACEVGDADFDASGVLTGEPNLPAGRP